MKIFRNAVPVIIFIMALPLSVTRSALAVNVVASDDTVVRRLSVNRGLIAQFESEYLKLKESDAKSPSALYKKRIVGVEFTLKALRDDAERLRAMLPEKQMAHEFMKELLRSKSFQKNLERAELLSTEYRSLGKRLSPEVSSATTASTTPPARKRTAADRIVASTRQLHERALAMVADKQIKEAMALYQEILLADPSDDQAYLILGHLWLLTGQFEKAEDCFHNAINIEPADRNEITPFYQNMIMQNPNDDMAYSNLGYAHIMLDEIPNAKRAFNDALAVNPDNSYARHGLGIISEMA